MEQQILALLKEGQAYAQTEDWDQAMAKWNQAIESATNSIEVHSWVATLLAGYGQLTSSKAQLEIMAQTAPDKAAATAAQIGLNLWEENQDWRSALQLMGLSIKIAGQHGNIQQLAFTSGNLANIVSAAGSLEASLIHYENAGKYYQQLGDTEWASMMWSSAGGVLKDLERLDEAEEIIGRAVQIASQGDHPNALTLALLNLGSVYGIQQRFEQSRVTHQQALRIAWQTRQADYVRKTAGNLALDLRNMHVSGMEEATELTQLAIADFQQKQYDWAIFGLKYAALLVDKEMDPIGQADIYHTLSNIEYTISDMESATVHIKAARQLARSVENDEKLAEYCVALSHLLLQEGKLQEAIEPSEEAIACAGRSAAYEPLAAALGNRGIIALKRDDLKVAENMFRRQYEIARQINNGSLCTNAANSLGAVYQRIGDWASAEKWYQLCIQESNHYQWPAGVSALLNLGIIQTRRGETAKATKTYQQALNLAIEKDNADLHFDALFNWGLLYLKTDQAKEAQQAFQRAAALNQQIKDPRKSALLDMNEGFSLKELGRTEEALAKFQGAFSFYQESDWLNASRCALEAAILLLAMLQPEAAMEQLLPAVEQLDHRLNRLSDHDAWSLHREEERCFQVFLEVTLQLYGPQLALLAAERSRGRAFRLALGRREAGHRTRVFDNMQVLRQAALKSLTSGKVEGLKSAYVDRMISVLSGAKDPQEMELNETWLKEQAKRLDVTIIAFAKGYPDKVYAWVINAEEIHFTPLPLHEVGGVPGLQKLIRDLRDQLGVAERGAGQNRTPKKNNPISSLQKLHQLLIDPLKTWLPQAEGAGICFVPWGPLFEIPFCALLDQQGRYFVERYASFVVPTLYFFGARQETPQGRALVVGDPIPPHQSDFGELDPLPYAVEEAQTIADLYQTPALIGKEATKTAVLAQLPSARIVHFAAHGLVNEEYPLYSAIALTPTEEDDGFLYADDLKKLALNSQLVVLSACSTALGNITGDGVLGLCREFLTAGTDRILASLWAVGDRSSAFHMTRFHESLQEKSALKALREAQLATKKKFDSVSQWGPYVLWG